MIFRELSTSFEIPNFDLSGLFDKQRYFQKSSRIWRHLPTLSQQKNQAKQNKKTFSCEKCLRKLKIECMIFMYFQMIYI